MTLGTTGMAFAVDTPNDMTTTAKMANVTITTVGDEAAATDGRIDMQISTTTAE